MHTIYPPIGSKTMLGSIGESLTPERDARLTLHFSRGHLHHGDALLRIYGVMVVDQFDEVMQGQYAPFESGWSQ